MRPIIVSTRVPAPVSEVWADVSDAEELSKRLQTLPGFGEYKSRVYLGVLAKNFGVTPDGYEALLPTWPNVSEIESAEDREELKLRKKAWKESQQG